MSVFLSCIATVVVEPGWLGWVARAQHAAPELLTFLEAARGQDPAFVLHGGGLFPVLYHVAAGHNQFVCLLLVVSASWCSQSCMTPGWVATSIPIAHLRCSSSKFGGLACVLIWQLTCPAAPRASV